MEKLILNPTKISFKKDVTNFFLGKWFANSIKKSQKNNIKFATFITENFNIENEVIQSKYIKKICKEILDEIVPTLNQLNNVNWSNKVWDFFLSRWLQNYISVILDRINLVKPLFKSDVNYDDQLELGRNTSLASYNQKDFTFNTGLFSWNEKLISRIIYLIKTQDFNNNESLLNSETHFKTINEKFFTLATYNLYVGMLKFLEKLFCKRNNFIFYNTYIKNKIKLFKIILKLGDFPFRYSFSFFNKRIIKKGIDSNLRKKILININSDNLNLKIIKFLLIECLPTIYLEGFQIQRKIANNSHLPKKVKVVFTSSTYDDDSFKFWLADQINTGINIAHGQHGSGYFVFKELFTETFETELSNKYFSWGMKENNSKVIGVGNYLLDIKKVKNIYNKNYLIVFPSTTLFKRSRWIFDCYHCMEESAVQFQKFIDNINFSLINILNLRFHPADDSRRELKQSDLVDFNNTKIKKLNVNIKFEKLIDNHSLIIFPYLSTEFYKMMSINKPCLILLNQNDIELFTDAAKKDFGKLIDSGILHTNGLSLAKHLNLISNDVGNWWNSEKIIQIKKEFCNNYSDPYFNVDKIVEELNFLK